MNRTLGKLLFATVATLALGSLASPASAGRRVSAIAGIAQQPSQAACFTNSGGSVTNTCPTRTFCVPLVYDWSLSNYANVTVTAKAPPGQLLSCNTVTVTKQGSFFSWSGVVNAPMNGTFVDIIVNGGGIPDGGAAYTCCDVPTNGTISVINY